MERTEQTSKGPISIATAADASSIASRAAVFLIGLIPLFATTIFGAVDNATWIFLSLLWAILVAVWAADTFASGGIRFSTSSLQLPIFGLILLGLVQLLPLGGTVNGLVIDTSSALSLDPYATRLFVLKLVVYATYFAACLAFLDTEKRLQKLVWVAVVFGALMAFYGILQRLATPEGIYGVRETSGATPFGPFVNQHHFATFMQMISGLTLGLLFGRGSSKERRILLAAALVVMGVATVSTSSRGGLLGFLGVIAFIVLFNLLVRRGSENTPATQRIAGVALTAIALLVVVAGVALLIGGTDSLLRGVGVVNAGQDISSGRLHFWPIALKIFLANPIMGSGLESFGVAFTKYDTWTGQFRVEQVHNEYLQMLSDGGIIGFLLLTAFLVLLVRKGLAVCASSSGFRQEAAVGALAGCFGVMLHSVFDFPLRTPSNAFFFLLLCAIATVRVAAPELHSRRRRRSTSP